MESNSKRKISYQLLKWYDKNKRSYPWRSSKINSYKILVTEILLRKTTREQVKNIFPIFFKKFPSVRSLSLAKKRDIEKVITPLGMERMRSKLLKEVSRMIVEEHSGRVPLNKSDLLTLPGVGDYIANATLLFAKKEKVSLVDTNAKRVVERIFYGSENDIRINKQTYALVDSLLPQKRFVEFNLSLLDFAALVCKPKKTIVHFLSNEKNMQVLQTSV